MAKKKEIVEEKSEVPVKVTEEQNELSKIIARFTKEEPWFVADNPKTSKKKLTELSKDDQYLVRAGVAKNPNTPISVLKKLVKDADNTVNIIAVDHLLELRRDGMELTDEELFECAHVLSHGNNLETLNILQKLKERKDKAETK